MEGLDMQDIPEEELNKKLDDEKKVNLLKRVQEAIENDALCIRDWLGIYEILLNAIQREEAVSTENYLMGRFSDVGNDKLQ